MTRSKRFVLVATVLSMMAINVMAYANESVEIWAWWDPTPQVKAELEAYVGVPIVHRNVPFGDFLDLLIVGLAAGKTPDMIYVDSSWFDLLAQQEALLDLAPFLEENPTGLPMDEIFPISLVLWQQNGRQLAMSNSVSPSLTWYNKEMLEELGLAEPDDTFDWDQWFDYARRATRDLDGDGMMDRKGMMDWWGHLANIIWSNGGEIFQDGQLVIDSPATEQALSYYKQFHDLDILADSGHLTHVGHDDPQDAWRNGLVLFAPGGDWIGTEIHDRINNIWAFEQGVAHVARAPNGNRVGEIRSSGIAIPAGTANPELAWKTLSYFLDDTGQSTLATDGLMPARHSIAVSPAYLPSDIYPYSKQVITESLAYQRGPDAGVLWADTYAYHDSPIKRNIGEFWRGEHTYSEAMENIKLQVDAILRNR